MLIHILAHYFGQRDYYAYFAQLARLYRAVYRFKHEPARYAALRFIHNYKQHQQTHYAYVRKLNKGLEHLLIVKYYYYQKRSGAHHEVYRLLVNIHHVQLCRIVAYGAFLPAEGRSHNAGNAYKAEGNKPHDQQYRKPIYSFQQFKIKHFRPFRQRMQQAYFRKLRCIYPPCRYALWAG